MMSVLASKVVKFSSHSQKGSGTRLCPHQKAGENQDRDLRGEPGVPQRQWHWRQSEALYTLLAQLLPVRGAKGGFWPEFWIISTTPTKHVNHCPGQRVSSHRVVSLPPPSPSTGQPGTLPCSFPGQGQRATAMWQVTGNKPLGLDYTNGFLCKWSHSRASKYGKRGNNSGFSAR